MYSSIKEHNRRTFPFVKICGITSKEAAIATRYAPADFVGFVFTHRSSRAISLALAKSLKNYLHPKTLVVALIVDANNALLRKIANVLRPDYFQLHGTETPERVAHIRTTFGISIIKGFSASTPDHMYLARKYHHADIMLFDSHQQGGSGMFKKRPFLRFWRQPPYLIAGGLQQNNVLSTLRWSRAQGVDVSSGVEGMSGRKVSAKIKNFINIAKYSQQGNHDHRHE